MGVKRKLPVKIMRRRFLFFCLLGLMVLILCINIYFVYVINTDKFPGPTEASPHVASSQFFSSSDGRKLIIESPPNKKKYASSERILANRSASVAAAAKITESISTLPSKYFKVSSVIWRELDTLWGDLQSSVEISPQLWQVANKWAGARQLVPSQSPLLGSILNTLSSSKILKSENAPGGTQLKLLLTLDGGQTAVFKPQWYKREDYIEGPVYSGKDRHNAEVAAFYLSLLLGLRRVPLTVGRKINLQKEIIPSASKSLLKTFLLDDRNNSCFYGDCHYCRQSDAVCGHKEMIEGALIMMLPKTFKLKKNRSPWQRTYKEHKAAKWEMQENFCEHVRSTKLYNPKNGPRLLDLIDSAIFDFLIDNGDRHHYEVIDNVTGAAVLFIDNGKSFGHPLEDHIDILAPFYQCCMIRQTTWDRLQMFTGGTLRAALMRLMSSSNIAPVLTNHHLNALSRRLLSIFATAELCFKTHGRNHVIRDDGYR